MRVAIDFEFTRSHDPHPRLICCSLCVEGGEPEEYWLGGGDHATLRDRIASLAVDHTFVAYASTAEARCVLALGLPPTAYKWVDLHAEFRQLTNHYAKYRYGEQWVRSGSVEEEYEEGVSRGGGGWTLRKSRNPERYSKEDWPDEDRTRPVCNLINALLKFLDIRQKPEAKDAMRDLILSDKPEFTAEEQRQIMEYCTSDIGHLIDLHDAMSEAETRLIGMSPDIIRGVQLMRGRYAADVALMEHVGMPLDYDALMVLAEAQPRIARGEIEKLNAVYPFYTLTKKGYVASRQSFADFVNGSGHADEWPTTPTGHYKADKETRQAYRHLPRMAAYDLCRSTLDTLKVCGPEGIAKLLSVRGSDGRVRPYMGAWGAQTSRNTPSSSTFIPNQARWLRSMLIQPDAGMVMIGADYCQQEFLIGGVLSDDDMMIEHYDTGDPYEAFRAEVGLENRATAKSIVLGLQYGMGRDTLARKVEQDTGRACSLAEAGDYIGRHRRVYARFWRWRRSVIADYKEETPLILIDGWAIGPDNPRELSVCNFPVQGMGQAIMRLAVGQAHNSGVPLSFTHHDALYALTGTERQAEVIEQLTGAMREAAIKMLGREIRVEVKAGGEFVWDDKPGEVHLATIKSYIKCGS